MNDPGSSLLHGISVGLPFGVALGVFAASVRVAGVDFRQWFRDPAQPAAYLDESWIGLLKSDMWIAFSGYVIAVLVLAGWIAWPNASSWRSCCLIPRVGDVALSLLPYLIGFAAGIVLAQCLAELLWRFGLAVVPEALPAARLLSGTGLGRQPERRKPGGRKLIVCCDGTWNWPDGKRETNVVRLARAIPAQMQGADGTLVPQISYYHTGVGTGNVLDHFIGGGLGVGLSNSVKTCYGFLVDNFAPEDEIFLFGFSRGAYVARSVAGLIGCVGMLQRSEMERFVEVWDWYTEEREKRKVSDLDALAPHRHEAVPIECIGVWDTVGALGIPGTRICAQSFAFHETQLGPRVRHAFQALAIDERRGNFQGAVWAPHPQPLCEQVLEQVWFPGVHSSIGGGYEHHGLSDTALLWMLSRIHERGLLELDMDYISSVLDTTEPYPTGSLARSRTLSWRIIGSPVPRPIGMTSITEQIHESAWERANAAIPHDVYNTARRRQWLDAHNALRRERCAFEEHYAVKVARPRGAAPRRMSRKAGLCDRVITLLGGNA
jgi:hypothetical protein